MNSPDNEGCYIEVPGYIEVPIYSEGKDEYGEYQIIGYRREYID